VRTLKNLVRTLVVLVCGSLPGAAQSAEPLVFNTNPPGNVLQGGFEAGVQFAQSQIMDARPRAGDRQPHLIGRRAALMIVRPLRRDDQTPLSVEVLDSQGQALGSLPMEPPRNLPRTIYHLEGVPTEGVDFTPPSDSPDVIDSATALQALSAPDGAELVQRLKEHAWVEIRTADGRWVRDIHLPEDPACAGKMVRIRSNAGYSTTVHYSGNQAILATGQTFEFKRSDRLWIRNGEQDNNRLVYAADAWSCELPAEWIEPGISLRFEQGALQGELKDLKVGAPTELLLHTIDIGLLTAPRGRFEFAADPEAQREYFQTAPVSRLIVSQYAPLALAEVMLPDGTLLTDYDPSEGGWHEGAMRQNIGKELISHGIDNANYGLHSTAGAGEDGHPFVAAQFAAHCSVGKYANGVQVHGGSGGNGMVTLDDTLGNEFSHEVGHNYGLGHYEGGFQGSVHRSADQLNSTWGWDAGRKRFIPNFSPIQSGQDTTLDDQHQAPFDGRSFGLDAMAGGAPFSKALRFTVYTPYSAALIQRFLESKAVFDPDSPTGFSRWNESARRMEPYVHTIDQATSFEAPVDDLNEARLAALFERYDVVKVSMANGNWGPKIELPRASPANRGRVLIVRHQAAWTTTLMLNGAKVSVRPGFDKSYQSDGTTWSEGISASGKLERKPRTFGAPVTTLVGYYDPEGTSPSYIYPALRGAYGFTYEGDSGRLREGECELRVETRDGPLRFRLAPNRLRPDVMNKFHVNVPTASNPTRVSVVRGGKVLAKQRIEPARVELTFRVQDSNSAQ
jgi:Peptidase M66/ToxR activated gene A lipoprotein domain